MLKVSIQTVDGGLQEWNEDDSLYDKLLRLRRDGYSGKQLIDELLTDDWGPPPSVVVIRGSLRDGTPIDESVTYD